MPRDYDGLCLIQPIRPVVIAAADLVLTGYGLEHRMNTKASYIKKDLYAAVQHLLK